MLKIIRLSNIILLKGANYNVNGKYLEIRFFMKLNLFKIKKIYGLRPTEGLIFSHLFEMNPAVSSAMLHTICRARAPQAA